MASVERQRRLLGHLQPAPASAVVEADVEAAAQALIGLPVEALDTPSLYVDLDAVESNIGVMSEQIRSTGAVWRPHTKAIRSPALAQMLVDGGAVGVTCAKITQAAALVAGPEAGDIFSLSSPVLAPTDSSPRARVLLHPSAEI